MMRRLPKRRFGLSLAALALCGGLAALAQTAQNRAVPAVGQPAPAYSLSDGAGKLHSNTTDKGHAVLLAFYPADFTGGCTMEAHALSSAYPELKKLGVTVYGVSVQDAKSHADFCAKEGIPYPLLADTKFSMARAFGVLIPGANMANRVTFLVGADGKIAYIDTNVNGHIPTVGTDYVNWVKSHPQVTGRKSADVSALFALDAGRRARSRETIPMQATFADYTTPLSVATVGRPAPAFVLANAATGERVNLDTLRAGKKALVLMFVSTRCPVSNAYNDRMVALAKKYAAKGVAFAGINANVTESVGDITAHAQEHGFPFPVLKDKGDRVADLYAAKVTPEAYVVGADGTLRYHGQIDDNMDATGVKARPLAAALDALLAGKAVSSAQPAAFGCSIKRG